MKKFVRYGSIFLAVYVILMAAIIGGFYLFRDEPEEPDVPKDSTDQNTNRPDTDPIDTDPIDSDLSDTEEDGQETDPVPDLNLWSKGLDFEFTGDGTSAVVGIGGCTDTDLSIPPQTPTGERVEGIGGSAFLEEDSVRSVDVSDGIAYVGDHAFFLCTQLKSITLPKSLTSVGKQVFDGCPELQAVYYEGTVREWRKIENASTFPDGCIVYCTNAEIRIGETEEVVYTSKGLRYTSNGDGTCSVSGIGTCTDLNIVIPYLSPSGDRVVAVGDHAFSYPDSNVEIQSAVLPHSVVSIGEYAFYQSGLKNVTLREGLRSIGLWAFFGCYLERLVLPDGVTDIGFYAIADCIWLKEVQLPDSLTELSDHVLYNCERVQTVTLPQNLKVIDEGALCDILYLTEVTIPRSVKEIKKRAFASNSSLKKIYYQGTMQEWENVTKEKTWSYHSEFTVYCTDGEIFYPMSN